MLSEKLSIAMSNFIEAAEKQEQLLVEKDVSIQNIVGDCERALECPQLVNSILKNIIEEYKKAL